MHKSEKGGCGLVLLDLLAIIILIITVIAAGVGLYVIHPLWLYIPSGVAIVAAAVIWVAYRAVEAKNLLKR